MEPASAHRLGARRRWRWRTLAPALSGLLLATVLAACGDDDSDQPAEPTGAADQPPAGDATVVELDEFSLEPSEVTVSRGDEITAENVGAISHNLTIERGDDPSVPSEELAATSTFAGGGTDTVKADLAPGRYALVCTVSNHRDLGMVGTLTVE